MRTLTDAVALGKIREVDTIVLAMPQKRREHLARFANLAGNHFKHTVIIPDLEEVTNLAVVARDFGGTLGIETKHNPLDPWTRRLKRVLDIGAITAGGVLILPLILMFSLLVWAESRELVFYTAPCDDIAPAASLFGKAR
jgi:hypothetical protein